MADPEILQQNLTHFTAPGDASGHSGAVVTHRLASGARPAGQQVCANAGDISAYVKLKTACVASQTGGDNAEGISN
jgi:hypothetical protein